MLIPVRSFAAALAERAQRHKAGSAAPESAQAAPPRQPVSLEWLLLAACLWWVLVCNLPFFAGALLHRPLDEAATWGFGAALLVGLTALHALMLAPLLWGKLAARIVLSALLVAAAVSGHFMSHLGSYLDPTMLRNTLRTDWHEARELLSPMLLVHVLVFAGLPLVLLWRMPLRTVSVKRALLTRLVFMVAMAAAVLGMALAVFSPLSSLMRNQRDLRYLINPAAPLWSLAQALRDEGQDRAAPLREIGQDAAPGERMAARAAGKARPMVVVLVVGETARSANWALNTNGGAAAYARATTPELSRLTAAPDSTLINFPNVMACGTNTETSLPCMFAPVGRRQYDERRIRTSQSLLHVAARAGVGVLWRDNQSGCKGVCEGLALQTMMPLNPPGLCHNGRCLDEALLHGMPQMLRAAAAKPGTQLIVLHMLGSHGPAYFRRYPPAFAHFTPECRSDDLRRCSSEEIVNAYDNTLRYTDHVLARLVATLQAQAASLDSAMLFVSDHGESLGEHGLFLHGLPYALAPEVQKRVPMVWWHSSGFAAATGLDAACLRRRAAEVGQPLSHDHLFHSLLGLLDVHTQLHEAAWDFSHACRAATAPLH